MCVCVGVCVGIGKYQGTYALDGAMVTSSASLLPFERSLWSRIASQLRSSFGHDAQVPNPRAEERGYLDIGKIVEGIDTEGRSV